MARALVTRPREDSQGVADALRGLGFDVQVEPLLDIVPVADAVIDTAGVQGVLATSANGVRALARACPERDWPVWAVGDASARAACEQGYVTVESAAGDVDTLAALVKERCDPQAGAFLHAAGSVTAGDLSGALGEAGFEVRRVVLYRAETTTSVSESLAGALKADELDVALFFSPRTAKTFVTLVQAAGLADHVGRLTAGALSEAVARQLAPLPWAAMIVAAEPTQAALLAALGPSSGGSSAATDRGTTMTETEAPKPDNQPKAEQTADHTAEQPSKGSPWLAILLALVLAGIIAAGAFTFDEWKDLIQGWRGGMHTATVAPVPAPPNEAVRAELTVLRERLAQLESRPVTTGGSSAPGLDGRLADLEAQVKEMHSAPQASEKLGAEIAGLAGQLSELKRGSADAAAVLRLADRLEKLEAKLGQLEMKKSSAVAVLLAVGQLREAVTASMPYDAELRALKALAGEDAEVARAAETLAQRAAAGIPTRLALGSRFHALVPAVVRAQALPEERTWWRQTLDRVATLVVIRREDGAAVGDSAAAIVARASARMAEGDLAGATAEMAKLEAGPAQTAAPWLADAQARLAADKALSELTAHVVAAVGTNR